MADSVSIRWPGRPESARTPARFRDRVLAQFRSAQNLAYLRGLLGRSTPPGPLRAHVIDTLPDAVYAFSSGDGPAYDVLQSDPVARRGRLRPALDLWGEVRRLNRAFFDGRRALVRDAAGLIDPAAPRDGPGDDDESYHMRMFTMDSLRPPGLEHLNGPGPLHELREDQSTWRRRRPDAFVPGPTVDGDDREGAAVGGGCRTLAGAPGPPAGAEFSELSPDGGDDDPWDSGRPERSPEQALAEYWGEGRASSATPAGAAEQAGVAYGDLYSWGDAWRENGGTRAMRYESIPFWQQGGREGYENDIEETLGTGGRELDGQVRAWDLDAIREPRYRETRRYGPRSGHVV